MSEATLMSSSSSSPSTPSTPPTPSSCCDDPSIVDFVIRGGRYDSFSSLALGISLLIAERDFDPDSWGHRSPRPPDVSPLSPLVITERDFDPDPWGHRSPRPPDVSPLSPLSPPSPPVTETDTPMSSADEAEADLDIVARLDAAAAAPASQQSIPISASMLDELFSRGSARRCSCAEAPLAPQQQIQSLLQSQAQPQQQIQSLLQSQAQPQQQIQSLLQSLLAPQPQPQQQIQSLLAPQPQPQQQIQSLLAPQPQPQPQQQIQSLLAPQPQHIANPIAAWGRHDAGACDGSGEGGQEAATELDMLASVLQAQVDSVRKLCSGGFAACDKDATRDRENHQLTMNFMADRFGVMCESFSYIADHLGIIEKEVHEIHERGRGRPLGSKNKPKEADGAPPLAKRRRGRPRRDAAPQPAQEQAADAAAAASRQLGTEETAIEALGTVPALMAMSMPISMDAADSIVTAYTSGSGFQVEMLQDQEQQQQ